MSGNDDRQVRILHVGRQAEGATWLHLLMLLKGYHPASVLQTVVGPPSFLEGIPPQQIERMIPSPVQMDENFGALASFAKTAALIKGINDYTTDIVHCHGFGAAAIGVKAAGAAGRKSIITVHWPVPKNISALERMSIKRLSAKADTVIAVSDPVRKSLLAVGVKAEKIVIVPSGVWVYEDWSRSLDVYGIDVPEESKIVLTMADLEETSGLQYLIEAAPIIASRVPDVKIVIAGEGSRKQELMSLAEKQAPGIILFLGKRTDTLNLLRFSHVFTLPSLGEVTPQMLGDAMSFGKPIVASDAEGISEYVEDGKTAILVPTKSAERLAGAIVKLLQDREFADQMGANARDYAIKNLSAESMLVQLEKVYRRLIQ